jgi:hypothetical protein
MVLKKRYSGTECTVSAVEKSLQIPKRFWIELDSFIKRNILVTNNAEEKHYCSSCLKAHALKTARELKFQDKEMILIGKIFEKCSLGHDGYYLDSEKLIKI